MNYSRDGKQFQKENGENILYWSENRLLCDFGLYIKI